MNNSISFQDTSIAFKSKSDSTLKKTYLLFWLMNHPFLVKGGTVLVRLALSLGLPVKGIIKTTLFQQFCGGETIEDCNPVVKALGDYKIGTVLDYSVEGEKSESGFNNTAREIMRTIEAASQNANIPFSVFKVSGIVSVDLLEKKQSKQELTDLEINQWNDFLNRIDNLCKYAFVKNVRLLIDAEESWIQDAIDAVSYEMMAKYNRKQFIVFNTFQMYRKDMLNNLKASFRLAEEKGYFLGVKLVRGAYMEKERIRATEMGYPDPIQIDKSATDLDYNEALKFCVEHLERIFLVSGSHNEDSNYLLMDLMEQKKLSRNHYSIYFAQLYGMSDHISYNLSNAGYNVAKYLPYGPVESVMPYLFRRAEENTSIRGQSSREFRLIKSEILRRKKH